MGSLFFSLGLELFSLKTVDLLRAIESVFLFLFTTFVFSRLLAAALFSSTSIKNDSATLRLCENNVAFCTRPARFFLLSFVFLSFSPTADGAATQTMLDPLRYAYATQKEREREREKKQLPLLADWQMETHHLVMKRKREKKVNT